MPKCDFDKVVIMGLPGAIFRQSSKNKNEIYSEKSPYIFSKKVFLIFWKMELSSRKHQNNSYISFIF